MVLHGAAVASAIGFATVLVGRYAISGTLSYLRMDELFSVDGELRLAGDYYHRWRHPNR